MFFHIINSVWTLQVHTKTKSIKLAKNDRFFLKKCQNINVTYHDAPNDGILKKYWSACMWEDTFRTQILCSLT